MTKRLINSRFSPLRHPRCNDPNCCPPEPEWRIKCITGNCRFARKYGQDEAAAKRGLRNHIATHRVQLFYGNKKVHTDGLNENLLPLGEGFSIDDEGGIIPF